MSTKRANNLVLSLAAVLSLLVSAVSACACAHHQAQVKVEEPSCHSAAHQDPAAELAETGPDDSAGTGCGCLVKQPVPAISAKSETKQPLAERTAAVLDAAAGHFGLSLAADPRIGIPADRFVPYAGRHLTAGPSRAPPRL